MEHLVVYSPLLIKKALRKRKPKLIWVRKRREPPVGVVHRNDTLYFKKPGGGVFAKGRVTHVKDYLKNGRYYVELLVSRLVVFEAPFPIIKRDRRSWVVCTPLIDGNQQHLIPLPSPTLEQILKAIKSHYPILPSRNQVNEAIAFFGETMVEGKNNSSVGTLFLVAMLASIKNNVDLHKELAELLVKHPSKVFPLSIFRGERK